MSEHRLIDANEAKELICGIDSEFAKFVDDIPTAYDIDKVVKQLNNLDVGTLFCSQCKYYSKEEIINICKAYCKEAGIKYSTDIENYLTI